MFNAQFICSDEVVNFLQCIMSSEEILEIFPWRNLPQNSVSPWGVSVGEVLLNRVTASRVLPIYKEIMRKYSSPCKLAKVNREELKEILKPLGLQKKKADLLVNISKIFCNERDKEIIKESLKNTSGIGKNTYNAILLFGFEEQVPLMDGVIGRIVGRIFSKKWKDKAVVDKKAWLLSEKLLMCLTNKNLGDPKILYYLLLDMGRSFCLVTKPKCEVCPCYQVCYYAENLV